LESEALDSPTQLLLAGQSALLLGQVQLVVVVLVDAAHSDADGLVLGAGGAVKGHVVVPQAVDSEDVIDRVVVQIALFALGRRGVRGGDGGGAKPVNAAPVKTRHLHGFTCHGHLEQRTTCASEREWSCALASRESTAAASPLLSSLARDRSPH